MKKIKFTIKDDFLHIAYNIENNSIKNINNTNIISQEDLIFDQKYFRNNQKLIAGFVSVIVKNEHIKKAIVEDKELIITSLDFLNYLPSIETLIIKPDIQIDYEIHLAILKNDTLKTINCFTIPTYLLERIDTTKSLKIETRNEVFFISNFLRVNKLNSYSDVFYKRKLNITYEFNHIDWQDFNSFLTINEHLRIMYFDYMSIDLLGKFVKVLSDDNRKNILFNIKCTKDNLNHLSDLQTFVKKSKLSKKNNYRFRIDYTQEYKMENFIKLLNFTTLKYIFISVIIAALMGYGINQYDIYESQKEINNINNNISELLEEFRQYDTPTLPIESTGEENGEVVPEPEVPAYDYWGVYYSDYSKVISILKTHNPDTVGWLQVNNTNINYPVVQSDNNSYYLYHDFNRVTNTLGWIFMDYRNNPNDLQQNTIIYGHNSSWADVMFRDLSKTLTESWYTNPENQTIVFNTIDGDKRWRIFSIYRVPNTSDYLYNSFGSGEEFLEFANRMKARSVYDFGIELKENDKILTLSTCQGGGVDRLAIHAVLVEG